MSHATKLIVLGSNLAAIWLVAVLVSRGIPPILVPTVVAFAGSLAAALIVGDIVVSIILATVYVFPTLCLALLHNFLFSYYAIWLAALCGAMVPKAVRTAWAFPAPFLTPLVTWALMLALSWPLVVLREVDFVPALLTPAVMAAARLPQSPAIISVWVASVASIAMTGLLLLDWLFLVFSGRDPQKIESRLLQPVLAGAVVAALVALYQSIADITFLNRTVFGVFGRTVGTMQDANAFGSSMAMWVPMVIAFAISAAGRGPGRTIGFAVVAMFLATAVWTSGSRTALLATVAGVLILLAHSWKRLSLREALAGSLAMLLIAGLLALAVPASISGPWARIEQMLPTSREEVNATAYQLWSRDNYGTAALRMIGEHPLVGIGVGGFNFQLGESLYRMGHIDRPPDNAQNWFRQQLAELGVLGSLGWLAWTGAVLWLFFRGHAEKPNAATAAAAKGAVVGLGLASLLGVPAQDTAVSITFVLFAFFCMQSLQLPALRNNFAARLQWLGIAIVVGCFLGGTAYAARGDLRPPIRAMRVDFPYMYGFARDPVDESIWWTGAKAVEVIFADKRWMKLELGSVAPDAEQHPVELTVRLNQRPLLRVNRRGSFPIVRWIRMPAYRTPMLIEIAVSRTFRPADFGMRAPNNDERGVAVSTWQFTDEDPPKGSITVEPGKES